MEKFKALAFGALIFTSMLCVQSASEENFEDADKVSDYSSSSFNGNNEKWDLRHTIPGEPEIDYPIYAYPIKTSFSCDSRHQGYYADVEARCQVFRICTNTALSGEGFAFLCPNGTLFSQKNFVCDWYRNVDCNDSENFYFKNEEIGKSMNHDNLMETVKEIVEYPMRTISKALGLGGSANLSQTKSQKDTSTNNNTSSTLPNNTNGEKLSKTQITDRHKSAGIDVRSDIITENIEINEKNQKSQTKYNNQQTPNRGRQRNDNRGRIKDVRTNQSTNLRTKPIPTGTPITNIEKEQTDSQRFTLPDKVYVNTLGELSTDVGSNFDIKTSYIIKPDADSTRRGSKKSLDDVIGDSEAYKNHLKNQQREKLREGLLGSTRNHKIISNTKIETTPKTINDEQDNLQIQSDTKLSFAESVNAGLTNLQNSKILIPKKLDKLNENYLNLADNINSGLFGNDKKLNNKNNNNDIPETIKKQENYQRTINIESRLGTASQIGQSFQGYETSLRTKSPIITTQNPNNYRNGRQFKFLGSGFTRTGEKNAITVEPYVSNLKNNGYLPPLLSGRGAVKSSGPKIKNSNINNNYNNNNNNQQQQYHAHQQVESKNQKIYYSIGTQQGNQKTESNLIKPSGSYTEIPGTNIKISKSNEETSFILSSDPRHQPQIIKSPINVNKDKNGYIPLNEYITNTLNGEIRNLATQTQTPNYNNLYNNNQQKPLHNLIPPFTTISPTQQQQSQFGFSGKPNFQTAPQFPNYGYQIVATTAKPYGNELINDNLRNTLTSFGGSLIQQQQQQQQQQQYLQNENQIINHQPILTQSYYNSFSSSQDLLGSSTTQKPSTNVNIYNNLAEAPVLLPDITIGANDNLNPNLQTNYQNFIFNPLPIAQRRLDVVKDDEKESEIYNKGITSYNVPIGSIGRLARRLSLKQSRGRK